jgi:dTDP-4-amino-4,6-dideoxygalactose transaminase
LQIPFLDLVNPHLELEDKLVEVFRSALRSGWFVGGRMVDDFEQAFADFCGTRFAIGVASGTDALRFALMAAGVGPGQTVITVPNTFIATAEAITQAGARVDFVDVDPQTLNMDPVELEEYFEEKCRFDRATARLIHSETGSVVTAVVPVHLYGQPADMDAILDLAARYKVTVIEDACQAHGAEYFSVKEGRWCTVGSIGHAAAFSFYPGKNLGACGEAGAVTTNDEKLADTVRMLRDHGQARKYYHEMEGYNGRLDAIHAGILQVKLTFLAEWNEKRRARASMYKELFGGTADTVTIPYEPSWAKAVYHLYVIRTRDREQLITQLSKTGIGTGIHYPIPLHLQNAYRSLGYKEGDFPLSEKAAREVVSLPMYPHLSFDQQGRVAQEALQFLSLRDGSERNLCVAAPPLV